MTEERFIAIFEDEEKAGDLLCKIETNNALDGLLIIKKYLPNSGIEGAEHDQIYATNISELIEAGITEDDVVMLNRLNWVVEDETYLSCFV